MKLVIRWVIIILILGSFTSVSYAVTKDELAYRVENSMKAGLVIPSASNDVSPNSVKESTQISYHRIEEMAAIVRGSSMKDIDERSADWLIASFEGIVRGTQVETFGSKSENMTSSWKKRLALVKRRFDNLDDTRVHGWIKLGQTLAQKASQYHKDYRSFLSNKFAKADTIQIDFQRPIEGFYTGNFDLPTLVVALGYQIQATKDENVVHDNSLDITSIQTDSRIMTLALVRYINVKLRFSEMMEDDFSYSNFFSAAFETGDPYHIANMSSFAEITDEANEKLAKSIELEGSRFKIKWPSFGINLWDVEALRYKELLNSLTATKLTSDEPVSSHAYLIFINNKEAWSLLNTHALSNIQ